MGNELNELREEYRKALQEKDKATKKVEELSKKLEQYKEDKDSEIELEEKYSKKELEEKERRKIECANVCAAIFGSGFFWFVHIAFWLILSFKVCIIEHVENEAPFGIALAVTSTVCLALAFWGVMNRKPLK